MRFAVGMGCVLLSAALAHGHDWASWRGPAGTGEAFERGLPSSTKDVLWRVPVPGRATPCVLGGRVFLIGLAGEGVMQQERVIALDLATGATVWDREFGVFHTDMPNTRVGWAGLVGDPETGNVYAHGAQGLFTCFDRDGKIVWSRSLTELYGRISGYGGRILTPVVDEDRVIIGFNNSSYGEHAKGGLRYLAVDKRTGEPLWWSEPGGPPTDTNCAVPTVAVIDGQRLLIAGNTDGWLYAINARTGAKVWGFRFSQLALNTSVVVDGHRVYATHGEENPDSTTLGRVVCFDGRGQGDITATGELWRRDGIEASYASPLLHDGRLYVMTNSGVLTCLDAGTGKTHWEYTVGRVGRGSPVWADGKIYATVVNGTFAILEDAGNEARLIDQVSYEAPHASIELFGSPAVSDGRVLYSTSAETVCLGTSDAAQDLPIPPLPPESVPDVGAAPALVQVRPCELLVKPGESVALEAVAFDDRGHPLGPVEAQWSCPPAGGTVDAGGRYQAPAEGGGTTAVTAKLGDLSAVARVRYVPKLPVADDLESYDPEHLPDWWIGVSKAKFALETAGGSKVLTKTPSPRGPIFNRSKVFITPPIAPGVTVEADVMGTAKGRIRGDAGLINNRYRLEMFGRVKRIRIVSWVPGPRFETRVDGFTWEPDQWYRVKFRVDVTDGKALVRAKVWPRGEAEPAEWTVEGVDPQPNLEGAAGLYAYSAAPVSFDNVRITREP